MSTPTSVVYQGDSLFEINGKTVDLDEVARNIVGSQDGDTIDRLIRENSDHSCEYHGADMWVVDFDKEMDDQEVAVVLAEALDSLDGHLLTEVVENYYTVV